MKKSTVILLVTTILVFGVIVFIWYMGFFMKIAIEEKQAGGDKIVGKEFVGNYSKVGKSIMQVHKDLEAIGVVSTKGFGIYYDDPKIVPADKCRSFVGYVLEEKDYGRISDLQLKGYKVDSIAMAPSMVAVFPIKTTLSYMVGPMKVYPQFSKYLKEKKYKAMKTIEIYDTSNKQIIFIMQYVK